ncbi:UNVERIFIED_CONTAM: protein transport protein Sec24-like [Sesamum calycinum]|uniref:Protein transport protein Sec24-like n=1 Tax=Sesamum calycinum TaxID=2727403 RepID=A0AAW2JN22_9LAMI
MNSGCWLKEAFPFCRPAATPFAAQQSTTPFLPSGPVAGSEASAFRPAPPASSQFPTPPFPTGALVGSEPPAFRPPPSSRSNDLPQPPSVPMGTPPQSIKTGQSNPNVPLPADQHFSTSRPNAQPSSPPMGPSYAAPRGAFQPAFPGYTNTQPNSVAQAPPTQPVSFPLQHGGYAPPSATPFVAQQRGFVPGPPTSTPSGLYSGNQVQQHGMAPPIATSQTLAEDFSSLSLGSVPGSFDAGLDAAALPRPLDGDVEPKSFAEMYPICSSCDSHKWHTKFSVLGISVCLCVVCPLGEAPAGSCRTYVNPYVSFTDNGRKWRCNICSLLNDVPSEYFAHMDATGRRVDLDQRPELTKGSVEFIAPAEYMVRPPMPPLYFFLIDVSISAVQSGMLEVMAQTIKSCLDSLPGSTRTQIGFITYDSTIHFYNMKSSLTQPQMMVVSDLDDIFVPLPDDLLVNLSESRSVVEAFLDSLPSMFQENMNVESAFGPALKAAFMVMSQLGGKLLIFQNTLPSLGVGRLRLHGDDIRVYGTDKEHMLRVPEDPFYKQMAADFTKYQIAVNVYAFSDKYTDIASLGTLAKYTGGQVYYYPSFQSSIHKDKLRHELARDLTRETAWEAVMRIRCGKGVRFTSYHGNFMLRSTDLLALPAVDCDKAYAAQLSLEETLLTTQTVYFQVALLRIRVHTAAAPVVADLGEMYRLADTGAIISLFSRLAIEKTLSSKLEDARNAVQLRIVKALREYRNLYAVQHRVKE